ETGLGTRIDLTAFGPDSTITCVTVTEMEGADDTAALDAALSEHDDPLAVLRGQIQAHQEFMTELQAACDLPQFQSEDIVSARNIGADDFVIYVDDRADPLVTG